MKTILLAFTLCLTHLAFSQFNMPIEIDQFRIIKSEENNRLKNGKSKINITVINNNNNLPLAETQIYLNTLLIGKTNKKGKLSNLIKADNYTIEADSPLGNHISSQKTFKNQYAYEIEIRMSNKKEIIHAPTPIQIKPCKPVIYLYPKKKQSINVQVIPKDEFLFTYPKYPENGWDIVAYPNGKIKYKNRTYNYLFWEGVSSAEYKIDMTKGFEVDSDTLIQFFENTLTKLGLTTEEQTDFITYWGPKLEENQLNFIHFEFTEECEKNIAELKISPKPDNIIRVFMTYHYIDELEYKDQQIIPTYERKGFTVVEWGGSYY